MNSLEKIGIATKVVGNFLLNLKEKSNKEEEAKKGEVLMAEN